MLSERRVHIDGLLMSRNYLPSPHMPCVAWIYRCLLLPIDLLGLLLLWLWLRQPVEGDTLPQPLLPPRPWALCEAGDDGPCVLFPPRALLHHRHQLQGGTRAQLLLPEGGVVAGQSWRVAQGRRHHLAHRPWQGAVDGHRGLGGAHVEWFRSMAITRVDYRLLFFIYHLYFHISIYHSIYLLSG